MFLLLALRSAKMSSLASMVKEIGSMPCTLGMSGGRGVEVKEEEEELKKDGGKRRWRRKKREEENR